MAELKRSTAYFKGQQSWPSIALKLSSRLLKDQIENTYSDISLLDYYYMPLVQGLRNVESAEEIVDYIDSFDEDIVSCKLAKYTAPNGKYNLEYVAVEPDFLMQVERLKARFEVEPKVETVHAFVIELMVEEINLPLQQEFPIDAIVWLYPGQKPVEINFTKKIK